MFLNSSVYDQKGKAQRIYTIIVLSSIIIFCIGLILITVDLFLIDSGTTLIIVGAALLVISVFSCAANRFGYVTYIEHKRFV